MICNRIEPIDLTNEGHAPQSPSRFGKRRVSDHVKTPPPKPMKERTRPFAARLSKTQTKDIKEIDEIDFTRPHDKSFPTILEAIHHASRTLLDLTPQIGYRSGRSSTGLAILWAWVYTGGGFVRCAKPYVIDERVS